MAFLDQGLRGYPYPVTGPWAGFGLRFAHERLFTTSIRRNPGLSGTRAFTIFPPLVAIIVDLPITFAGMRQTILRNGISTRKATNPPNHQKRAGGDDFGGTFCRALSPSAIHVFFTQARACADTRAETDGAA